MARQAPVAGDLRLVMALLQANHRIARMEPQRIDIATLCGVLDKEPLSRSQLDCLAATAELVDRQVAEAAHALSDRDIDAVRRVQRQDVAVNKHNRARFKLAVGEGSSEAWRHGALHGALMARALERIGDNTVEIARLAAFIVTGELRAPA